ncbi:hypothetical protein Tco_0799328 [Tanacetum coccineum]|uniref:Uncharacterized protein n=1 Tax=Tanacetum coccineum TaxID=301880 RepID=A0ABQ4ZR04_9ASTR
MLRILLTVFEKLRSLEVTIKDERVDARQRDEGDKVDWDVGPTDSANVEVNLRRHVRLGKWALIFKITSSDWLLRRLLLRSARQSLGWYFLFTYWLSYRWTSDPRHDLSFDIPTSSEYMSGLDRDSLAEVIWPYFSFGGSEGDYTSSSGKM